MQRYEKTALLLDLALEMQSRHMGISLKEIAKKYSVSHRTAQRMVRGLELAFPQMHCLETDTRELRWSIPSGNALGLVRFSADELAALESAISVMKTAGRHKEATLLKSLEAKAEVFIKRADKVRMAPDIEALLQAEGLVATPGPRRAASPEILEPLRHAIKAGCKVIVTYNKGETSETYTLEPYGFLYGHRHYLVAINPDRGDGVVRKFRLGDIRSVKSTTEFFERDTDFDLAAYSKQSFGVFADTLEDVEWLFSKKAAATAFSYQFHPDEVKVINEDGSLTVKFSASGIQEMAWHLMIWGQEVEVISPPRLAELVNPQRPSWELLP